MGGVPVGHRPFARNVAEIQPARVLVAGQRQIRTIIPAHAADFVTTAAAQRMEQRFGVDQPLGTHARGQIRVDGRPVGFSDRPERGRPQGVPAVVPPGAERWTVSSRLLPGSRLPALGAARLRRFVLGQVLGTPVGRPTCGPHARQIRTFHPAFAAGTQRSVTFSFGTTTCRRWTAIGPLSAWAEAWICRHSLRKLSWTAATPSSASTARLDHSSRCLFLFMRMRPNRRFRLTTTQRGARETAVDIPPAPAFPVGSRLNEPVRKTQCCGQSAGDQ